MIAAVIQMIFLHSQDLSYQSNVKIDAVVRSIRETERTAMHFKTLTIRRAGQVSAVMHIANNPNNVSSDGLPDLPLLLLVRPIPLSWLHARVFVSYPRL